MFIDLETTGLDEQASEIIEFAGVRVVAGEAVEEFSQLANPGQALPLAITKLTGIRDADLRRARPSHVVLSDFLRFIGDDVVVAHNAAFERKFLAAKSDGYFRNTMLDTLELARILWPTFPHHDLDTLIAELELEVGERHRALDDARVLIVLWERLVARLDALPLEVVSAVAMVAARAPWPARRLFLEAEERRMTSILDVAASRYGRAFADHGELLDRARDARRKSDPSERPPPRPIDVEELRAAFGAGGVFEQRIPGYEIRPQQVRMAELVSQAFNEGKHLLVEAGTGVGKSMAYLLPAIRWAQANGDKIVVSTNTKNLQEQLFYKDLPLLAATCGLDVRTALIKGRGNYVCVRKLLYLLDESERELTEEEHVALLPVLVWAAETEVGDVAECTGFLALRERDLWAKLCASSEECPGPYCRHRNRCFLNRARALAMTSDVVVANHAVVFAELALDSVVLPDYAHLIFDEAHNLEDAATDFLGCEIDHWTVRRVVQRLLRHDRGRHDRGLLPSIRYRLKKGRETSLTDSEKHLDKMILAAYPHVEAVEERLETFLLSIGQVLRASGKRDDTIRYDAAHRDPHAWAAVEGENTAKINIANSNANRREQVAEAERRGTAAEKVRAAMALEEAYQAEQKAEMQRAERERATKTADIVVGAQIDKQRIEIEADAVAKRYRREAKGQADAIFAKMEAQARGNMELLTKQAEGFKALVDSAARDPKLAALLMITDKLPELVGKQVEAIKNLKIDQVTVWDSMGGGSGDGTPTTAKYFSGLLSSLPPLQNLFEMAGMKLPDFLDVAKREQQTPPVQASDAASEISPSASAPGETAQAEETPEE